MRLDDFKYDKFSQFGEDGVLITILRRLEPAQGMWEFGAGDGVSCSSTN